MSFCEYPASFPSVCIPRVTGHITERVVWDIFHSLHLGDISQIEILWNAGKKDSRVIIHWKFWNVNHNAQETRQRLLNGGEFRAFYHPDKFWKVYQYMPQGRRHPSVKDAREEERQKRKAREEEERQKRKAREEEKKHKEEREELTREELYAIEVSYQVMINTIQVEPPPTNRAAKKLKALTPGFNRQSKSKFSNILITALYEMPSSEPFSNALFWLKKEENDDPHLEMLIEKLAISQQLLMDASAELRRLIES